MPDFYLQFQFRIQELCEQINVERDYDRLISLVRELNELMEERKKRITEPGHTAGTA